MGSDLLDSVVTAVGTLVASVLTFVVPAGFILWGFAVFRDRGLPVAARIEPGLLMVVLVTGGAAVSALPDDRELGPQFAWFAVMAALIAHFSVASRTPRRPGPRQRRRPHSCGPVATRAESASHMSQVRVTRSPAVSCTRRRSRNGPGPGIPST